jgi:Carboxypeptidase activation peptide
MKLLVILFGIFSFSLMNAEKIRYDNYHIYRVKIGNEGQLKFLQNLEVTDRRYNFWETPVQVNMEVPILVDPSQLENFDTMLANNAFDFKVVHKNFQE